MHASFMLLYDMHMSPPCDLDVMAGCLEGGGQYRGPARRPHPSIQLRPSLLRWLPIGTPASQPSPGTH